MMDDTGVPVIGRMLFADGWRSASVRVRGRSAEVFISPDGERYVKAGELEKADLIYHAVSRHFTQPLHVRFRLEEGSQLARKIRREQRLVARGEKQREQRAGFEPADSIKRTKHVRRKR